MSGKLITTRSLPIKILRLASLSIPTSEASINPYTEERKFKMPKSNLVGKQIFITIVASAVLAVTASLQATVTGQSGYQAQIYYSNPHSGEAIVSFDFSADGNLFYTTGDPNWGTQFTVYEYDGNSANSVYSDPDAWAGSRVTRIGEQMYFNDGGNDLRGTFDYYRYNPTSGGPAVKVIDSLATNGSDCWGLSTRDGSDLWAAGDSPSIIRYSQLDAQGDLVTQPMTDLGSIGGYSGPLVFDSAGNLYYAHGYGDDIYRFTSTEVAAAIADPSGSPLDPSGHLWANIGGGATGATSMFVADNLGLVMTAVSWGPSELRQYTINPDGTSSGYEVLATSTGRMGETRHYDGTIYVAVADGIYTVPEPATLALLGIGFVGLALRRRKA